jgi:regulator of replication initiation timing
MEFILFGVGLGILAFAAYVAHVWTKDHVENDVAEQIADLRRISMAARARNDRLAVENRNLRARLSMANVSEPELPEWLND